jgi:hypothetical protein
MFNILYRFNIFTCSPRGTGFLSGHADGTIVRYYVVEDSTMEQQVVLIFIFLSYTLYTEVTCLSMYSSMNHLPLLCFLFQNEMINYNKSQTSVVIFDKMVMGLNFSNCC